MVKSTLGLGALALVAALFVGTPAQAGGYDTRDVVRDTRGNVIVNSLTKNCVRTKWQETGDVCPGSLGFTLEERTVYFGFDESTLRSKERMKLDALVAKLQGNADVKATLIVGYADRIGDAAYNQSLSKARAETVRQYLQKRGVALESATEVRWFGESNPSTECGSGLSRKALIACLQPDRRVEVEVEAVD